MAHCLPALNPRDGLLCCDLGPAKRRCMGGGGWRCTVSITLEKNATIMGSLTTRPGVYLGVIFWELYNPDKNRINSNLSRSLIEVEISFYFWTFHCVALWEKR